MEDNQILKNFMMDILKEYKLNRVNKEIFGNKNSYYKRMNNYFIKNIKKNEIIQNKLKCGHNYIIKYSFGQGQWTDTPWIAFMDTRLTSTASNGIYIVFLFKADMTGGYLTLNQGVNELIKKRKENKDKYKNDRVYIQKHTDILRKKILQFIDPHKLSFSYKNIDLCSDKDNAKNYEAACLYQKEYSYNKIQSLTDDEFIQDINELITIVNTIYDQRLFEENFVELFEKQKINEKKDHDFDDNIYEADLNSNITNDEIVYTSKNNKVFKRDSKKVKNALKRANYKCEINCNHETFKRKTDGYNYTEAHHLIPLYMQDNFEKSLDIEENIISLCSNCHRKIHYGLEQDKLIKQLYIDRKEKLSKKGLNITLEELLSYYD